MRNVVLVFALIILNSCFGQNEISQSDTLFKICRDESNPIVPIFPNCGYANEHGDTIIPVGLYVACFSNELVDFAIVLTDTSSLPLAVNRAGEVLFTVIWLSGESWPDELNEDRIRIIENGKIGYANQYGIVVIEPQFSCASSFQNGIARVSNECRVEKIDEEHFRDVSESWIYIDKNGVEIK